MIESADNIEYNKRSFDQIAQSILQILFNNKQLLHQYCLGITKRDRNKITVQNLEIVADNHLFDDFPELFGITKLEGHTFREYFQINGEKKSILAIREKFPNFFDEENDEFIAELHD